MAGRLFVVATPIGNLGDMTHRAVEALCGADMIAAEDTKASMTLLDRFDIKTRLVSNHKFNEKASADYFLAELQSGKDIALISDAGTPCVSDPGSVLVARALENNIEVVGIPGACAAVLALSVSGFDLREFAFSGFFPRENAETKKLEKKLENGGVHVFYESPKRIEKTIEYFGERFPECELCLCNDLTKKFERIYRGPPALVLTQLQNNPDAQKGEYTIVVDLAKIPEKSEGGAPPALSAEATIAEAMVRRRCTAKEAVKSLALEGVCGFGKNELYAASLNLKKMFGN